MKEFVIPSVGEGSYVACAAAGLADKQGFSPSRASHFFLLGQEKVTKKKAIPANTEILRFSISTAQTRTRFAQTGVCFLPR